MLRLIPREERFFEFFNDAASNILDAANALARMMEEGTVGFREHWKQVEQFEHEGDAITHRVIRRLNQAFITPIDREDIHSLAVALDDVMDLIEAAAARMALYKIAQPTEEARRLTQVVLSAAQEIVKAVSNLERMDDVTAHCTEINRLESVADDICRQAIASLFEKGDDPVHVIKWKDIYETLETTTDRCEDVANIVESVAQRTA
ncbi:MAG: DUF47 domain-containing protein [Candidatus Methylomirabilaceae bacterium]